MVFTVDMAKESREAQQLHINILILMYLLNTFIYVYMVNEQAKLLCHEMW